MTIRELIAKLQEASETARPEAQVYLRWEIGVLAVRTVEVDRDGDVILDE